MLSDLSINKNKTVNIISADQIALIYLLFISKLRIHNFSSTVYFSKNTSKMLLKGTFVKKLIQFLLPPSVGSYPLTYQEEVSANTLFQKFF